MASKHDPDMVLMANRRCCIMNRHHQARSRLLALPVDLQIKIILHVGDSYLGYQHLAQLRMSCKDMDKLCSEPVVYRSMKLPRFDGRRPYSSSEIFLHVKLLEHSNREILYRYSMIDFFMHKKYKTGYQYLKKANSLGHVEAPYLSCVFRLLQPVDISDRHNAKAGILAYDLTQHGVNYKAESRLKLNFRLKLLGLTSEWFFGLCICDKHTPQGSGVGVLCPECTVFDELLIVFDSSY